VPTMAPILQQQQQQHLSQLQQAASGTHTTCHSPGDRRSGGTSPRAAAHAGRLSDCPLEPLTAAEAAQGIGSMQVAAWPTAAEQHSMSSSLGACAQGTVLQQLSLRGRVDAAARAGVLWSISDCPAEALKALHAAASAALKQDMAAALASASAMPVSGQLAQRASTSCLE
jgi:hypothetical protein